MIGREAEFGCEAEQITSRLGLVTCSMVVSIRPVSYTHLTLPTILRV